MRFNLDLKDLILKDAEGKKIGIVIDLVVKLDQHFPRVTYLVVKLDKAEFISGIKLVEEAKGIKMQIPIEEVGTFRGIPEHKMKLGVKADKIMIRNLDKDEILIGEGLLDQEILNSHHLGLGRVNDVLLVEEDDQLRLVGLSIGIYGLLERLGLEGSVRFFQRYLGQKSKETIVPWNFVRAFHPQKKQIELRVDSFDKAITEINLEKEDEEAKEIIDGH
jgi:sporulation protein YlmC with PRC-barrel domain